MPNPYYTPSGYPATNAAGSSASMRSELASIETGFNLLPTLSGNGGKFVLINSGGTAQSVSSTLSESGSALTITGTVSGTAITSLFASPPAIGGTAAAAGAFTTLSASGTVSGAGFSSYLASPPAIGGTTPAAAAFTTLTTSSTVTVNGGTANQVQYLNASKVLSGSANLTFDGTTLTAAALAGPFNGTVGATTPSTGSFTTLAVSSTLTLSAGTANGVPYLNASKALTSGSALVFDGTNFGIGIASPAARLDVTAVVNSLQARFGNIAGRGLEVSTAAVNGTNDAGAVLNAKGAGDGTLIIQLDSSEKARFNGGDFLLGGTATGAAGIGLSNLLNYSFAEGSGASYANLFRQTSSAATVLANGYKRSATANGFASSTSSSWAKSAVVLNNGDVVVYADAAATVANGTDATPTERFRVKSTGQTRFLPLAADPSGAENGDVYYNSTTSKLRVRAGGAWVDLH